MTTTAAPPVDAARAVPTGFTAQVHWTSPLGGLTLARRAAGLGGAWFDGQRHHPGPLAAPVDPGDPLLRRAIEALADFFAGRGAALAALPLAPHGTAFQCAVWQALGRIAPGATTSYAALAASVGRPGASRAVGAAVGRNPLSVIVPCHRVLGSDGSLTGYAGGLARKQALLRLEGAC
ncbi:methylated-DNA--[protein]-cysteine S-methyltransferase [Piscinibacter sakaiensis]|uniref:Methylated-DNA--protein-cysteine methyltransferase n=1 Tax=Piscinibacter sakaiensis TaxID=1547922 RepID=A0A0K8P2R6_PISS1|nr:methylated-DNA--[protein]-cysteine S-methyltransferase [Piscinibacter sakaiensis]GAP36824.1 methylated-DNA--protein-cysteine methyltransferase [Piscinibacter sakaiensis]